MHKHIITFIVAASAVFHAQAADLESQLLGYWQPDMEKTVALAKKANREMNPMTLAMLGKMVFEFQKRRDHESKTVFLFSFKMVSALYRHRCGHSDQMEPET